MTLTWKEQFQPIVDFGWGFREGQEKLGNAIIKTLDGSGKPLVGQAGCGTGKSLASVIPVIHKIKEARKNGKSYRAVISTETITLQRQLEKKDLPFLQSVYKDIDFTYHKLLGRSNYLCLNRASDETKGNKDVNDIYESLDASRLRLTSGEREDVQQVLGRVLSDDMWSRICGETNYCSDNSCTSEDCYAAHSREIAQGSDIVIVNHKILAIDFEMKNSMVDSGGMFGNVDAIIVDEAHKLEETLIDQWSERFTIYEIEQHLTRLVEGAIASESFGREMIGAGTSAEDIQRTILNFFSLTQDFFSEIEETNRRDWAGSEISLKMQFLRKPTEKLRRLMNEFETTGSASLDTASHMLEDITKKLTAIVTSDIVKVDKRSKKVIKKALTSCKYLSSLVSLCASSMNSEKGIIKHRGLTYGVVVEGWINKKDEKRMTIRAFPIDISDRANALWSIPSVFLSATLIDLTRNDFAYFKKSMGIRDSNDIMVSASFDMTKQQLVYVTAQNYPKEFGTHFSVQELVEVVNKSRGRALLLFTSRSDLNLAKNSLMEYKKAEMFPYPMFVQEPDSDKAKLVDDFKADTNSVMLGLKSMFTGIDIPGESLSLVVICKFPLPRYSTECRMKIDYWRGKGFPDWYSRESLTVFQQAAGRLIRSDDCTGVVALLDQRAYNPSTTVFKTASLGVSSLGSRVTHDVFDIEKHLGV